MTDDFLERFEARRIAREQADRTFVLAGETFRFRPTITPEVVFRFRDSQQSMYEDLDKIRRWGAEVEAARAKNGDGAADLEQLVGAMPEPRMSDDDLIQIADETILACLEPASHEAWAKLRSPENLQPVTYNEVFEIVGYLLGRVTEIPTVAPTGSSDGRTETARPSKASSSSRAKTPAGSA